MSREKNMAAAVNAPRSGYEVLRRIRGLIGFHRAMGIEVYPRSGGMRRFLEMTDPGTGVPAGQKAKGTTRPGQAADGRTGSAGTLLRALRQEVAACTGCVLAADRLGVVPGRGGRGCRLMVVGDWSAQDGGFAGEILFGPDEDVMLGKMMAAIGLAPEEVYVTNCIKCCPAGGREPDSACAAACFSFVSREIAVLEPPIICAMGDLAAGMLTGRKEPLIRLRGRFTGCRPAASAVVMPTFHPRLLLRNPEMKKAVWSDLQAIRRRLEGKSG
ncbi:MAG: uracil-DNA glycosylase [Desulfobulbaceae bacterium]|nr:uracil-DNA glycosylase [Desulfobulbaceae bacterium]MDY0351576.1 uracil-DNA glycosylase [Desulfobulbaceae bacterium]